MRFTCSSFRSLAIALALCGAAACSGELAVDDNAEGLEQSVQADSPFVAVRQGSGKCLDVNANGSANGTKIQQWSCNGTSAQTFELDDRGNGEYRIVHPQSGKCLDIEGNGSANGTRIHLWSCHNNANQRFRAENAGGGFSRLVNPRTGKCVDVSAASNDNGAQVQLWDCNGTSAQAWNLGDDDGGDDGSTDDGSTDDGDDDGDGSDNLVWRRANLTHYTSYPDPGSEECVVYNGCTWAGYFAFVNGQQPESWVRDNNIAAVHSRDARDLRLKTLRLRQNGRQIDVKVYDMCSDSDCNGCCSRNADANGVGFLIDIEKYTLQRFGGNGSGIVEWACLDCQ